MFFKKKSKIEQPQSKPQQKPATIQERMTEVYNLYTNKFLEEKAAGKVDIEIPVKFRWWVFECAVVGCLETDSSEEITKRRQILGKSETVKLAQKAALEVKNKFIKFAESQGFDLDYDSNDYLGFKAKERKDLSKIEEEITTWQPS